MASPRRHNHPSSQESPTSTIADVAASSFLDNEFALLFAGPPEVLVARLNELGRRAGMELIGRTMLALEQAAFGVVPAAARGYNQAEYEHEIQEALEQQQQQ
jgi:hypothetical protein